LAECSNNLKNGGSTILNFFEDNMNTIEEVI